MLWITSLLDDNFQDDEARVAFSMTDKGTYTFLECPEGWRCSDAALLHGKAYPEFYEGQFIFDEPTWDDSMDVWSFDI